MSLDNNTMTEKPFLQVSSDAEGGGLEPDPDPYGWEAELEKRVVPSSGDIGLGLTDYSPVSVLQYRRAGGAKKTLLQRVLSFGPNVGHHAGN